MAIFHNTKNRKKSKPNKNDSKKKIISERDISRKDFYARSKLLSEKILCDKKNYFKTTCIRLPGVLSKKIPKISSQSFLKGEVLMKFITLMMINKDIQIFNPLTNYPDDFNAINASFINDLVCNIKFLTKSKGDEVMVLMGNNLREG